VARYLASSNAGFRVGLDVIYSGAAHKQDVFAGLVLLSFFYYVCCIHCLPVLPRCLL
jgi:hypothetical protein